MIDVSWDSIVDIVTITYRTPPGPFRCILAKGQLSLHVPGTTGYTAPELFCGAKATKKCDIYSLAICLWHLWTWKLDPYPGLKQPHVLIYSVVKWNKRPEWQTAYKEEEADAINARCDNGEFCREYVEMTETNWNKDPKTRQTTTQILKFIKRWRKKVNC